MPAFFTQPKFLLALILAGYFVFGLHHLTQFVTADEHYWVYERIPQYWNAVGKGDWKKTFINDKPGVTLALISGVGTLFYPDTEKHCAERDDRTLDCDTEATEHIYFAFRLPILIINALLLIVLFFLIKRLADPWISLSATALTALSPILLGSSQIINPDSLLWSFSSAAIFSFFSLLSFEEKKYLFLTVVFTAFAILSKYVAVILLPFFLSLVLFRFLTEDKPEKELHTLLKRDLSSFAFLSALVTTLVCLFLPALLMDSKYFLEFIQTVPDKEVLGAAGGLILFILLADTFLLRNFLLIKLRKFLLKVPGFFRLSGAFFLVLFIGLIIARNFFPAWDIFALIPFDIKDLTDARYHARIPNFFESFLLEWNPVVFSLTPIALFGFAALLLSLIRKNTSKQAFMISGLFFFFTIYSLLLIYSNILTTPRYSIMLYSLFAFLSALGIHALAPRFFPRAAHQTAFAIVLLGSLWSLALATPFPFNYTNVLLPKTSMIQDAWGYGGYEAAQYLNSLPDAEHLTVWADYYGVCEFFVGRCLTAYTFDQHIVQPDYYVLTRRGAMRYLSRSSRWERLSGLTAYKYYSTSDSVWELFIGDRPGNFVKVVKVENGR